MINMTKIDYVINITGASYDIVRKALLDSDGDVDVAISYIREGKYDVNVEPSKVYEREMPAGYWWKIRAKLSYHFHLQLLQLVCF